MFTSGSASKIYLKFTAFFTAVFASVIFVFAPILPTLMGLIGVESILGIDLSFSGKTEKPYVNVLLLGVDKSEKLSDVMMVAQLNMLNNSVNILQVPRDTYINNKRSDKKLNSAYGSVSSDNVDDKVARTMEEMQTVIDIEFDGYVLVTTSGFRDVIDAVGGIEYNVPADMNYDDDYQDLHIHLKKGMQILNGDKAEQYVRFRSGYASGDLGRIDAQGDFIKEAMKQILEKSNSQSAEENNKLLRSVGNMVSTNFEIVDMLKYAPYILKIDMEKVNIMRLEGTGEYRNGISYFIADKAKNDKIIYEYFSHDTTEVDLGEIEARDNALGKNSITKNIDEYTGNAADPLDVTVYLMDYSGTGGESLNRVQQKLADAGYNVIGSIEARTCSSDKSHCISKAGADSAAIAEVLGLQEYMVNSDLNVNANVVVIIGKDI